MTASTCHEDVRERLADGRHWVEFDAENASGFNVQADLRDNRFGTTLWSALDPSARIFIATAEALFRTHRRDAAFDLSVVVVGLAKAVGVQGNRVLRRLLDDAPPAELADIRNRAAPSGRVSRDEVIRVRAEQLGVGQTGDLIHLAQMRRMGE